MHYWNFMVLAAWYFSYELFKWIAFGFLAPSSLFSMEWGQSEQRQTIPLTMELNEFDDIRGQTLVSTGASSSQQVQDPALWMVCCPCWLGAQLWRRKTCESWSESCKSCSFPFLQPSLALFLSKYSEFNSGRTKAFICSAPPVSQMEYSILSLKLPSLGSEQPDLNSFTAILASCFLTCS